MPLALATLNTHIGRTRSTYADKVEQRTRDTGAPNQRRASTQPRRVRGRMMGVVSLGPVGRAIAARASAFGVNAIVFDPYVKDEVVTSLDYRRVGKDELLAEAHYLLVQVPMTPRTNHRQRGAVSGAGKRPCGRSWPG